MIKTIVCENGVRIVHEKMSHIRSVAMGIWVEAGSADERQAERGIAHFIEHMLFKGTKTRSARQIAEEFDRIGGDINAFTSKETTCLYATVLNNHAEQALTILADMFFNSTFDEAEISKEKSVVLDEIASVEDTPDDDVQERLWAMMYPAHSIGQPVLGKEETIATFDKKMIDAFMNRMYRPENIVISVAGNFDEHLIQKIEKQFGSFHSKEGKLGPLATPEFKPGVSVKSKDIEQSHLCFGFESIPMNDSRKLELAILDSIVGGSMSSRLFQEVREERGIAYSIYSYYSSYKNSGAFIIYGGTAPENTEELSSAINHVIDSILKGGVTENEVHNAKEQLKGGFLLGLESSESRMHRNGSNELTEKKHQTIDHVVSLIDGVEVGAVNKLAMTIFTSKRAISLIAPEHIVCRMNF